MSFARTVFSVALGAAIFSTSSAAAEKVLTFDQVKPRAVLLDGFEEMFPRLVGAWAFTAQIFGGVADCQYLLIDGETYTGTDGKPYLVVERAFTTLGLGLVSRTDYGKWLLLLDSSTNYYLLYEFDANGDAGAGLYWIYQKDASPTGAGSWMRSFRFAAPDQLAEMTKAIGPSAAAEVFPTEGEVAANVLQVAEQLKAALEELASLKARR